MANVAMICFIVFGVIFIMCFRMFCCKSRSGNVVHTMSKKPIAMGCARCRQKMQDYDAPELAYLISTRMTLDKVHERECGMCMNKLSETSATRGALWPVHSCATPAKCGYFVCNACLKNWWRDAYNDISMERKLGPGPAGDGLDMFVIGA